MVEDKSIARQKYYNNGFCKFQEGCSFFIQKEFVQTINVETNHAKKHIPNHAATKTSVGEEQLAFKVINHHLKII